MWLYNRGCDYPGTYQLGKNLFCNNAEEKGGLDEGEALRFIYSTATGRAISCLRTAQQTEHKPVQTKAEKLNNPRSKLKKCYHGPRTIQAMEDGIQDANKIPKFINL